MTDWEMITPPESCIREFKRVSGLSGLEVSARYDGCFTISGPDEDDWLHVCDPREFAEALIALCDHLDATWTDWAVENVPNERFFAEIDEIKRNDPGWSDQ